jgi:hypothetical protein
MTLRIGDEPETVVGVLPKSFRFTVLSMMPGEATQWIDRTLRDLQASRVAMLPR